MTRTELRSAVTIFIVGSVVVLAGIVSSWPFLDDRPEVAAMQTGSHATGQIMTASTALAAFRGWRRTEAERHWHLFAAAVIMVWAGLMFGAGAYLRSHLAPHAEPLSDRAQTESGGRP